MRPTVARLRPSTMPAPPHSGSATPGRTAAILGALAVAALVVLVLALSVGSVAVDGAAILRALTGSASGTEVAIVRELRLPRALAAFAVGGLLALAGALMQVLLRNPLADPYILGLSGGAAVGALGAMLAGAAALVTPAALAGAFASTLIVFGLARTGADRAPWTTTRLLLTGVIVAAGWGALIALHADPRAGRAGQGHALLADRRPGRRDRRDTGARHAGRRAARRARVCARSQRPGARRGRGRGPRRGGGAHDARPLRRRRARHGGRRHDRRQRRASWASWCRMDCAS